MDRKECGPAPRRVSVRVARRHDFRSDPVVLVPVVLTKLLLVANALAPLAPREASPRQNRASRFTRVSRPQRAAVRSWRSDSPKASASFILFARVPVRVQAAVRFWPSLWLRYSVSRVG